MCVLIISLVLFVFIDFYIEIEECQKVACSIGHHFATLYILSYLILNSSRFHNFLKGSDGSCVWGALTFGSDLFATFHLSGLHPPLEKKHVYLPCMHGPVVSDAY